VSDFEDYDEEFDTPPDIFEDELEDTTFWQEPDFLLNDLVTLLVHRANVELDVTLFLKGMVLTGTLVAESVYLSEMTTVFMNKAKSAMPDLTDDDLQKLSQAMDFKNLASEDVVGDELIDTGVVPLRYIHVKNPQVISAARAMTFANSEIPILRLRLNMVDGWLLGRATQIDDSSTHTTAATSSDIP